MTKTRSRGCAGAFGGSTTIAPTSSMSRSSRSPKTGDPRRPGSSTFPVVVALNCTSRAALAGIVTLSDIPRVFPNPRTTSGLSSELLQRRAHLRADGNANERPGNQQRLPLLRPSGNGYGTSVLPLGLPCAISRLEAHREHPVLQHTRRVPIVVRNDGAWGVGGWNGAADRRKSDGDERDLPNHRGLVGRRGQHRRPRKQGSYLALIRVSITHPPEMSAIPRDSPIAEAER